MRVSMNIKIAAAIVAHHAAQAVGADYIQFVQTSQSQLPDPVLTTIYDDGIYNPAPTAHTGAPGTMVFETEVCRPVTTTSCDIFRYTSMASSTQVMNTSTAVVLTTEAQTTETSTSTTEVKTSTTVSTSSKSTAIEPTVSASETPVPTSGAEKQVGGAGLLTGFVLWLLI